MVFPILYLYMYFIYAYMYMPMHICIPMILEVLTMIIGGITKILDKTFQQTEVEEIACYIRMRGKLNN